jgi:release factor glutamine methyltransferase
VGAQGSTLAEAAADVAHILREVAVASPEVDARWLVEAASGIDPRRAPDVALTAAAARTLADLVARRRRREPLQLVVGTTAFRTIELRCRAGVFVPRPETEVLAGIAIDLVRDAQRGTGSAHGGAVVVHEPCCGTGAVGLAVASEVDGAVVLLGDRSAVAVTLAEENRDALDARGRLRSRVEVHRGDLLDAFVASPHGAPDVIVANPPYLPSSDLAALDPEVAQHDPHDALAGGPDGHEVVDALLDAAAQVLAPGGAVVLEIDVRRADEAVEVARRCGLVDVGVRRDLTDAPRFVVARRPRPEGLHR